MAKYNVVKASSSSSGRKYSRKKKCPSCIVYPCNVINALSLGFVVIYLNRIIRRRRWPTPLSLLYIFEIIVAVTWLNSISQLRESRPFFFPAYIISTFYCAKLNFILHNVRGISPIAPSLSYFNSISSRILNFAFKPLGDFSAIFKYNNKWSL